MKDSSARETEIVRWTDLASVGVSIMVLFGCVTFILAARSQPSFDGFELDPRTWVVVRAPNCPVGLECPDVGDRVLALGDLSAETYLDDWSAYLYRGLLDDGSLPVTLERGGRTVQVVLPPAEELSGTQLTTWGIPLVFWLVGTGVALFVRPRNASWLSLLLLCWSTAMWLSAGLATYYHTPGSMVVYHGIIWLFLPLLIHTHLLVPYPVLDAARRTVMPLLYVSAATLAYLDFAQRLPLRTSQVWAGLALLATSLILVYRLLKKTSPHNQVADRILLFGVAIGFVPLLMVIVLPLVPGTLEARHVLAGVSRYLLLAVLPIWPLSYLYALSKRSGGSVEIRANRLLGTYGFLCILVSAFLVLYSVVEYWIHDTSSLNAVVLGLAVAFIVATPPLKRSFQRLVDRTVYGIKYLPEEIVGVFAARIPRAFDIDNLRSILLDEVLPTLMIRESALYIWNDEGQVDEVYRDGDPAPPPPMSGSDLDAWREPHAGANGTASLRWARMAVPLYGRERTLGVWLLGRRDPDDLYPAADRELLHSVANQIAPVVENIRLVERAQREVEENRRLQQQLIQSQKMEAIGRLSAGVAHDFNNLLSVILGYSSLLLVKYKGDDALTGYLDDIRDAGDRAAALTRQLLAFSRQQVMEARTVQLNHVVVDVERMLQRLAGEDVEVRTQLGEDLPKVRIDSAQMGQVVMNLAVNARDAMPGGGVFTLTTESVRLEEELVDPIQGEIPPGQYVLLAVSDTGVGMAEGQLQLIFEPYFTTKELGKGTGLGLSMVYGIVSQFHGHIRVESELEQGTRFTIYLPAQIGEDSAVAVRSPFQSNESLRGTESVLLVEDEDSVRHVACEILQAQGYRVTEACDGTEALDLYDEMGEPPDLLLTDVVMPQMKGTDLAVLLTRKQPELRVLFMSGYNEESVFSEWKEDHERPALLAKPFSPTSLLNEVRAILDAEPVSSGGAADRN